MSFISQTFLFFLPLVFGLTYSLPSRWRVHFLLAASYLFYMAWKPQYVLVIIALTVFDYFAAIVIENQKNPRVRQIVWLMSLAANLGSLIFFKYLLFLTHELNWFLAWEGATTQFTLPDIVLPIGISFHTFQAMSYTTDVYLKIEKAERRFFQFALFIAWFPQMVAGPIERAATLLKQLHIIHAPTLAQIRSGLVILLWGLFKKIVIADNLAPLVDMAFSNPASQTPLTMILGVYAFSFQIYCDFSGYTDIAVGSSLLFGVQLTQNFERPYLARSLPEFWKRWHISLSQWFFEYVYYPFVRRWPTGWGPDVGIILVFVLSGIWHGANWTFLIWGLLNGVIYSLYRIFNRHLSQLRGPAATAILVLLNFHLVTFCWIFFRAESVNSAGLVLNKIASALTSLDFALRVPQDVMISAKLAVVGLLILLVNAVARDYLHRAAAASWRKLSLAYAVLTVLILAMGQFDNQSFLYFQF
ncbi:MAG: MBOAT family protein [Bdellovibrionales bacterium]